MLTEQIKRNHVKTFGNVSIYGNISLKNVQLLFERPRKIPGKIHALTDVWTVIVMINCITCKTQVSPFYLNSDRQSITCFLASRRSGIDGLAYVLQRPATGRVSVIFSKRGHYGKPNDRWVNDRLQIQNRLAQERDQWRRETRKVTYAYQWAITC